MHGEMILTYSMVQSLIWEANWFAASQEITCISRNPKVHYRTHKRPPPVSILGQPNPVHIPTSYLLEICLILSTHLRLGLPSGLFPSGFPTKTLYTPSPHPYAPHAKPFSFFSISSSAQYWVSSTNHLAPSSLCSLLHSTVTSSLLGPNILLNTMFSNTLSFLSSRNVSDQVSHPYKTTGKIVVLYEMIKKKPLTILLTELEKYSIRYHCRMQRDNCDSLIFRNLRWSFQTLYTHFLWIAGTIDGLHGGVFGR